MPVFDRSASRPSRSETELLRGILGPARGRTTSLQLLSRQYRSRQRRARLRRAAIVLALFGFVLGSAAMMTEDPSPSVATVQDSLPALAALGARQREPAVEATGSVRPKTSTTSPCALARAGRVAGEGSPRPVSAIVDVTRPRSGSDKCPPGCSHLGETPAGHSLLTTTCARSGAPNDADP